MHLENASSTTVTVEITHKLPLQLKQQLERFSGDDSAGTYAQFNIRKKNSRD